MILRGGGGGLAPLTPPPRSADTCTTAIIKESNRLADDV